MFVTWDFLGSQSLAQGQISILAWHWLLTIGPEPELPSSSCFQRKSFEATATWQFRIPGPYGGKEPMPMLQSKDADNLNSGSQKSPKSDKHEEIEAEWLRVAK